MVRHKNCLLCEIDKVINRFMKKGDEDLAGVLYGISQIFLGYSCHPSMSKIRDDQIAVAAKALINLIVRHPEDTINRINKQALSEVADVLGSLDYYIEEEKREHGATAIL